MLQAALLLLGFALSLYFWEINTTIASVVLAFTSFGVLFFLFIVVAGATSVSCSYQTPGAQIICRIPDSLRQILGARRRILYTHFFILGALGSIPDILRRIPDIPRYILYTIHHIPHTFTRVFSTSLNGSVCFAILGLVWFKLHFPSPISTPIVLLFALLLPVWLLVDTCMAIICFLGFLFRRLERGPEQQTVLLDLRCISWTLQTSLDGPVRLPTLKYLATIPLADSDPALVVDCFNILFGCVKTIHGGAAIAQGMGQLAEASSLCCLQTLSHLLATDPTSRVLMNTCMSYARAFQFAPDLDGLQFSYILRIIHRISHRHLPPQWQTQPQVRWEGYGPPSSERASVARALADVARFEYQWGKRDRVPCWILRFAFHTLSQSPLPPATVVVDCLAIIAIGLGCDTSSVRASGEVCSYFMNVCPPDQWSARNWMRFLT